MVLPKVTFIVLCVLLSAVSVCALEPNEILVIANRDVPASVNIAKDYCTKRGVPAENLLLLSLGRILKDTIERDIYEKDLAEPIKHKLSAFRFDHEIRCLLTVYGVPFKVKGRGSIPGQKKKLKELTDSAKTLSRKVEQLKDNESSDGVIEKRRLNRKKAELESEIDRINGKETGASVDSELSLVLRGDYELYRWQPNVFKDAIVDLGFSTLMVSRLDGPGEAVVSALVDKAMAAEKNGLKGAIYVDSRGIERDHKYYSTGYFDQSLRDLAVLAKLRTNMNVKHEQTGALFAAKQCPRTAIYCGWYSVKKYVDAFDFVDGAVGYHIASFEAVDLRDAASSQWCPAMLGDGITATLGAVAEPYLHAFPEPRAFFRELFNGRCLVEAYYHTKPFHSWQLILIGDPLYRPFPIGG
jgi:uncharacterized protein (TIGR03790 family)